MSIITSFSYRKFYGLFNSTGRQHFIKTDGSFLHVSNCYPVTRHWAMNQHLTFIVWNSRRKDQICLWLKANLLPRPSLPPLLNYMEMVLLEKYEKKIPANQAPAIYVLKHRKVENIFKWLCCYLYLVITKWMLAFSCSKY